MSSFMVSADTIDRVIAAITWGSCNAKITLSSPLFRPPAQVGKALLNMNYDAIVARYEGRAKGYFGSRADCTLYAPKTVEIDRIQMLKSVQCLIYQCAEGDVPDRPLWKALDIFLRILESEVGYVRDHDAPKPAGYEAAIWG